MAMASKTYMGKMKARNDNPNVWYVGLVETVRADPCYCCCALLCPLCASWKLRKRALYDDMSRCCGGYMAGSGCCGECRCPGCCLCIEVCLCFPFSIAATRYILQDEFDIKNTNCDKCIIGCMEYLRLLSCIFCVVDCILTASGNGQCQTTSMSLSCCVNILYCLVCVFMQTQHKIQMDNRDGHFGQTPPPVTEAPPVQQMSRIDRQVPPPADNPPPAAYPPAS